MSYADVIEGLHERFATVTDVRVLVVGEPTAAHETPLLYSLADSFRREIAGRVVRTTWRTLHRLCVRWQDNPTAEAELLAFADSIPAAVDGGCKLAGRLIGDAAITTGEAGWVTIGGTIYRAWDFYSEVLELTAYRG